MKKTYNIKGMHCVSCEILLDQELKNISGIKNTKVSHKTGVAEIEFDGESKDQAVEVAVKKAGYALGGVSDTKNQNLLAKNILENLAIFILVGFGLALLSKFEISKYFPDTSGQITVLAAIGVGIVASLSTCLAMTGGLIMGFSSKLKTKHKNPSLIMRTKPQIYFHSGRLVGFFVLGGLLGLLGNAINFSLSLICIITGAMALLMFYLGLNIMGLVPDISALGLHLPKSFAEKIKNQEKINHAYAPALLGILTFFLPCGFTQSMQLLAVGSGSFVQGGLIMFFFALGTMPILFSIGLGSSFSSGRNFKLAKKFIGALIIFFAIFSLNNAIVLAGGNFKIDIPFSSSNQTNTNSEITSQLSEIDESEVQVVKMEIDNVFMDTEFRVKKDIPVRWEINAIRLTGCSNEVIIPKLGLTTGKLKKGINILEFTATESGILPFSCWMGMQTGRFIVE